MADRNHRVLVTPDEQNRQVFGQITPVQHRDHLAAPVDDGAQGPQIRLVRRRSRELAQHSDQIRSVVQKRPGAQGRAVQFAQQATRQFDRGDRAGQAEQFDRLAEKRHGRQSKNGMYVLGDATGGHQSQPVDHARELVSELHGDAAAQ